MTRRMPMPVSQQSSATARPWALPAGQALRLAVGPGSRWLQARSGALWLTRSASAGGSEDLLLQAGEGLALPAGSDWVLESWAAAPATFELLVPPGACARAGGFSRLSAVLRAWRPALPAASSHGPQGAPA